MSSDIAVRFNNTNTSIDYIHIHSFNLDLPKLRDLLIKGIDPHKLTEGDISVSGLYLVIEKTDTDTPSPELLKTIDLLLNNQQTKPSDVNNIMVDGRTNFNSAFTLFISNTITRQSKYIKQFIEFLMKGAEVRAYIGSSHIYDMLLNAKDSLYALVMFQTLNMINKQDILLWYESSKETILHKVSFLQKLDLIHQYLSLGLPLDINIQNANKETPLHYSVITKSPQLFSVYQYLISKGAKVDKLNKNGDTPLQVFLKTHFPKRELLSTDADKLLLWKMAIESAKAGYPMDTVYTFMNSVTTIREEIKVRLGNDYQLI